jgi:hypothetical protein
MTANAETHTQSPMGQEDMRNWAQRGTTTAAFLLVIPGSILIGLGIGMLTSHMMPNAVIGFGAGMLLWGLIVALTK